MNKRKINLIIDSTMDKLLIILFNDEFKDVYLGSENGKRHAANLMEVINNMFHKYNVSLEDDIKIGVVVGPGSFTGIRIGVASANALRKAFSSKIVELNSLEIILGHIANGIAVIPCKNSNYYALVRNNYVDSYTFINDNQLNYHKKTYPIYCYSDKYLDNAIQLFNNKLISNSLSQFATPFYIRETSAERNREKCLDYEICLANIEFISEIYDIERNCFEVPWSMNSFKNEMSITNGKTIVLKEINSGSIVGFACYRIIEEDAEIMRIAIKKELQRNGLGSLLLNEVIRQAKEQSAKKIYLEVAVNNFSAIRLYEKHSFLRDGLRKNYYGNGIDGLLLSRCLN